MKKAEGEYVGVRAITREEAIALAPEIFRVGEEIQKLHDEVRRLWTEGDKLWDAQGWFRTKAAELWAEGNKLNIEASRLWTELAIKLWGYVHSVSTMSFIAADREDLVYSFNCPCKEIQVYDGEGYPDPDRVEKLEWRKG